MIFQEVLLIFCLGLIVLLTGAIGFIMVRLKELEVVMANGLDIDKIAREVMQVKVPMFAPPGMGPPGGKPVNPITG